MAKVTMPQLGESVAEGTIGRWLKQPGDTVAKYEPLLEVITDKVNAEVPSPYAGVLREILFAEGSVVPNNTEIAIIDTDADAPTAAAELAAEAPEPVVEPGVAQPAARDPEPTTAFAPTTIVEVVGDPDARMTPAVRRLLRENGLEAAQIAGTGGGGRITREDVLTRIEALGSGRTGPLTPSIPPIRVPASPILPVGISASIGTPAPAPAPRPVTPRAMTGATPATGGAAGVVFPDGADEVLLPMTTMRKGIAAQMTRALAAPHAYVMVEVDVTRLVRLRDRLKGAYQAKEGIGLSFVPFVVKAAADALKRNPTLNAHWTDQGLLAKRRINIGVAVAVDEGLIVPVIRDADQRSVHGLNLAIADVAARARAGKLRLDDFGGGTFTVDNTGYLGTTLVMPILNVPEVGIVTMEAITKRPVVVSGPEGDVIAIRSIMNMVLGIDHRANDGAAGAALLRDIKAWLEGVGPETAVY